MATKKKDQEPVQFKVGDTVHWTSQAGGSTKTKEGAVVHVVPGGSFSGRQATNFIGSKAKTHRSAYGGGWNRAEDNYVIEVVGATAKSKPVLYWPPTSLLRPGATPKTTMVP